MSMLIGNSSPVHDAREGERGAALIMTLMVAALLLAAGGALITATSTTATNMIDTTAEQQAYYAAEAGMQAALNALRGNRAANYPANGDKMDFRRAVTPLQSNAAGDLATVAATPRARLSRWLPYSSNGTGATASVGSMAYSVIVELPSDDATPLSEEPPNIIVTSTGLGPRGARKVLSAVIGKGSFDITPPAAIAYNGCGSTVSLGSSSQVTYSGYDASNPTAPPPVPAIATAQCSESAAQASVNNLNCGSATCTGGTQVTPSDVGTLETVANVPAFLQSPDQARAFLAMAKALAAGQGRLFSNQAAANAAGGLGTLTDPKLTVIDNYGTATTPGTTVSLGPGHQGTGLLIVTGNFSTNGNTDFEGIILVLGRGQISRSGGGNGVLKGSVIFANFDPNDPNADTFGASSFDISGGGNSTVQYDTDAINKALKTGGRAVLGVAEK